MTEDKKTNPFPVNAAKERLEELDKEAIRRLIDYCNEDLPDGKLGISRIKNISVLQDIIAYEKVGMTRTLRSYSESIENLKCQ